MSGIFDGMRASRSGIRAHSILQEVVGHNIANASNKNYTRQEVSLTTMASTYDGRNFFGQGVDVAKVERVRDTLLDGEIRNASSSAAYHTKKLEWLSKIETVYNEPSDQGVSATMASFFEAFTELATDPESLATRSNVVARAENLSRLLGDLEDNLRGFQQDLDQAFEQTIGEINARTTELAALNEDIFEIEAGKDAKANDLRDKRDAVLDELSELIPISFYEEKNGMVSVMIGSHPAVVKDSAEPLVSRIDTLDPTKVTAKWKNGDTFKGVSSGELGALLDVRDTVLPAYLSELNTFTSTLISETNSIYANGVSESGKTLFESRLGYKALGVNNSTDALALVKTGEYGSIKLSFHDANGKVVRTGGIVIDSGDSLSDIQSKLNGIKGIDATLISSTDNDGRLSITLDQVSGENVMGETTISLSNNEGGFDSSGFLNLLSYHQTDKSTNSSAAQPLLASRDLTELQTVLGESTVAAVRAKALGLSGSFTINAFETGTESASKTNGQHVQQLTIDVATTDSIDSIMAKVNALTAQHGISMSFNGATNKMELTSTARTDAEGNVLTAGGTNYLRLAFANTYRYPDVAADEPPTNYNGLADNTNLLARLQMNTLFSGKDASDIALDSYIQGPSDINAGHKLASGNNGLALLMSDLQHKTVALGNKFTLAESYENSVSRVGTDIDREERLSSGETLLKEGFIAEKDRISGVNLDEELAKMIQFQRSYDANAKMLGTFNQMAQEVLSLL